MWNKRILKDTKSSGSGVDVSLEELINLRNKLVFKPFYGRKKSREYLFGQSLAKIRGRGIEFDSTREYQPGDDIRRMAWRMTARSFKPLIKVYHEEKDRPVWLAIDLSPSMYFGTRCMFKSVSSIKQAALLGWSYLHKRERIGAIVTTPNNSMIFRPYAHEREFLTVLKNLSAYSRNPPAYTETNCLSKLLLTLQQQISTGNLLFILSDFLHFDDSNQNLILYFAARMQVVLIFVYDPFEASAPPAYQYLVSDGQQSASFNMYNTQNRHQYQQQFQQKLNALIDFTRKHNIYLHSLRTDQEQERLVHL